MSLSSALFSLTIVCCFVLGYQPLKAERQWAFKGKTEKQPTRALQKLYLKERKKLLAEIISNFRETAHFTGRTTMQASTIDALNTVPRHHFVPATYRQHSYDNNPLSIGAGQTISQPYIVALMTDFADLKPTDRVLEIGTGSGYQAAILGHILRRGQVYSIEIIKSLHDSAKKILSTLKYDNVKTYHGDGYLGLPSEAPFDAIIVTAAAPRIPQPLLDQLRPGGRMIIPEGGRGNTQWLKLIVRRNQKPAKKYRDPQNPAHGKTAKGTVIMGDYEVRKILPVRFVPFTGQIQLNPKKK